MRFLDYMFYRLYIFAKKNKEAPVATAALGIAGFLIAALPIVWIEIPYLLFGWMPENTKADRKIAAAIVTAIIFFCVYFRYKPREKEIVKRYEHSKYNEKIPFFVFPLATFVVFLIGILEIILCDKIEEYGLYKVIRNWFLGLFQ
ncbi:MAG: hypothetical protein II844_03345 [Prevotella sp.]|nr:hypothetical protein [Prevotella sp.]